MKEGSGQHPEIEVNTNANMSGNGDQDMRASRGRPYNPMASAAAAAATRDIESVLARRPAEPLVRAGKKSRYSVPSKHYIHNNRHMGRYNVTAPTSQDPTETTSQPGALGRSRFGLQQRARGPSVDPVGNLRLQSMGQTNESPIDLLDDDDEIEVVGVQPSSTGNGRSSSSTSSHPLQGNTFLIPARGRYFNALNAASSRSRGLAQDPPDSSSPQEQQQQQEGPPSYGRKKDPPQPAGRNSSSSVSSLPRHVPRSRHARGRLERIKADPSGRNPIKFDVDTEEDFANMENDVEVIEIEDDSDDECDDEDEGGSFLVARTRPDVARLGYASMLEAFGSGVGVDQMLASQMMGGFMPNALGNIFAPPSYAPNRGRVYRGRMISQQFALAARRSLGDPPSDNKTQAMARAPLESNSSNVVDLLSDDEDEDQVNNDEEGNDLLQDDSKGKAKTNDDSDEEDRKPAARPLDDQRETGIGVQDSLHSHPRSSGAKRDSGVKSSAKTALVDNSTETDNLSCASSSVVTRMPPGEETREVQGSSRAAKATGSNDEHSDNDSLFVRAGSKPYELKEFRKIWEHAEHTCGETEELEQGKGFKNPKSKHEQYGRVLPLGMKRIFRKVQRMTKVDSYVDIGHGIGNTCLQAAYTLGCHAKGVECNGDRCEVADKFDAELKSIAGVHRDRDGMTFEPGKVELKQGELQDPALRDWLLKGTDFVFVNNYEGTFRHGEGGNLDMHVAALFAGMKEGSVLVTMEPLMSACGALPLNTANEKRREKKLPESDQASYYKHKKIRIGRQREVVSWSEHSGCDNVLYGYCYERVGAPTFLCNNPDCETAISAQPIDAVQFDSNGVASIGVCECRFSERPSSLRNRKQTQFYGK